MYRAVDLSSRSHSSRHHSEPEIEEHIQPIGNKIYKCGIVQTKILYGQNVMTHILIGQRMRTQEIGNGHSSYSVITSRHQVKL